MKKLLLILLFFPLLFTSCVNQEDEKNDKTIKESFSENVIVSFNVTSKNPELTSKKGTDVSTNEMITKTLLSGDKILFKDFQFTLDNKIEGALNFYSMKGKLMCNTPTELSVMNMPPDGSGATTYMPDDNIEFSAISLIKINSINFVISDIKFIATK